MRIPPFIKKNHQSIIHPNKKMKYRLNPTESGLPSMIKEIGILLTFKNI